MSSNGLAKSPNQVHAWEENTLDVTSSSTEIPPRDLSIPAFIVTLLFNHVLGFFSYHYTVSSRHRWQQKNYKAAKKHSSYAKILLVLGFLLGLATYAVAIYLYFTLKSDITCTSNDGIKNLKTDVPTTTASVSTTTMFAPLTQCCEYCGGRPGIGGSGSITNTFRAAVIGEPNCDLYCKDDATGSVNPVPDPDPNAVYPDCCSEFICGGAA